MGEPIYTLRPWKNEGQYYLVKWADSLEAHKEPLDIYYMAPNYCGCPSPRKPCKHMAIKDAILDACKDGTSMWQLYCESGRIRRLYDIVGSLEELDL